MARSATYQDIWHAVCISPFQWRPVTPMCAEVTIVSRRRNQGATEMAGRDKKKKAEQVKPAPKTQASGKKHRGKK